MRLYLQFASVLVATTLLACGGSSNTGTPTDAGGPDATKDSGKPDGTVTDTGGGGDVGGDDGGPIPIPTGTLLVNSDSVQLLGVTGDGYAIYAEVTAAKVESINAISVMGGTPKKIVDLDAASGEFSYSVNPNNGVVITYPGLSKLGVGQVHVWTAAGGDHLLANLSYFLVASVSLDGKYVMYANNVTANGLEGDIYVAGTDGSNPTALVKGASLQGACAPVAGFAGDFVVASYCPVPQVADAGAPEAGAGEGGVDAGGTPDAGGPATTATLQNFAAPSWTATTMLTTLPLDPKTCGTAATMANGQSILTSCGLWSGDKAGTKVALADSNGNLQVYPLPTGAPIMVDTLGPNQFDFVMRTDGMGVLYSTSSKALKSSPLPAVSPKMLATGVGGITQLSPDDSTVLYYNNRDSTTGIQDLYMTSVSGGTPVALASMMNAITFAVDFTTDSKYATWYANAAQLPPPMGMGQSPGLVGDLTSTPVGGGKNNTIDTQVWSNLSAAGSKVVYQGNYLPFINPPAPGLGIADILSVDVSGSGAGKLIVSQADATGVGGPFLTAKGDQIIYTFSRSGAGAGDAGTGVDAGPDLNGLYVVPVP